MSYFVTVCLNHDLNKNDTLQIWLICFVKSFSICRLLQLLFSLITNLSKNGTFASWKLFPTNLDCALIAFHVVLHIPQSLVDTPHTSDLIWTLERKLPFSGFQVSEPCVHQAVVRWSSKVRWSAISFKEWGQFEDMAMKIRTNCGGKLACSAHQGHLDYLILVQMESVCFGDNKVKRSLCHQSPHGWMQNSPGPGPAPVEGSFIATSSKNLPPLT